MIDYSDLAAHVRRTILDMSLRRQRPGSGSISIKPDAARIVKWPNLTGVLTGIPWAVAGGVATRQYMPERATQDLDIVVLPVDEPAAERLPKEAGYRSEGPLNIGGSGWRSPDGVVVDLLRLERPGVRRRS